MRAKKIAFGQGLSSTFSFFFNPEPRPAFANPKSFFFNQASHKSIRREAVSGVSWVLAWTGTSHDRGLFLAPVSALLSALTCDTGFSGALSCFFKDLNAERLRSCKKDVFQKCTCGHNAMHERWCERCGCNCEKGRPACPTNDGGTLS